MRPIGIAVIGAGPWGLTLAGAFARVPEVEICWICDLEAERRARAGVVSPGARLTDDADEAVGDPSVQAVVVAVDPARHHPVALRALEAGKHVFVEKPLALTGADAEALQVAARTRGLVLTVGHLLLHHPAIRRARQMVAKGLLGEPLALAAHRATPGAPRRLGSAWWALAPHDVSLALHVFGALPSIVSVTGEAWGRAQEDNAATALLQFPGGRTARIDVARHAPGKRRDMTVSGPQATLTFDELAPADLALRLSAAQRAEVAVPIDARDVLLAQCRDFAAAAARGDESAGNGAHAVDVVRVLEAGERSMRHHGAPQALEAPSNVDVADASTERASSFEAA